MWLAHRMLSVNGGYMVKRRTQEWTGSPPWSWNLCIPRGRQIQCLGHSLEEILDWGGAVLFYDLESGFRTQAGGRRSSGDGRGGRKKGEGISSIEKKGRAGAELAEGIRVNNARCKNGSRSR